MSIKSALLFPPFSLDSANAQLWQNDKQINLRRKSFDVLCYLIDHAGELVTKATLLDALWPDVIVGDNMPANSIKELRHALGDDAQAPRFIETVHRRGYRFIAKVTSAGAQKEAAREPSVQPPGSHPIIVGREEDLARLRAWWSGVLQGRRHVVFISGEAGIGKSTFVEAFIDAVVQEGGPRIARGQCIEQYGSGEPYMPVLEALSRLGREAGGDRVIDTLGKFAPTWLTQMPELLTQEARGRLQSATQGVTQQRMLREMTQALQALAIDKPLVLLLEDLHWSDFSTIDLISAVARRREPTRLLILGTYRPFEVPSRDHPLRSMKQELELHHCCEELRLALLRLEDVGSYLAQRVDGYEARRFEKLASLIHARTDGNPLFMVNMTDYLLLDAGLLVRSKDVSRDLSDEEWGDALRAHPLDALRSVRHMIERNLERLKLDEQKVLEGASIVGTEFSAALVAAALDRPQIDIETCCIKLSRREQFISERAPVVWPDGTVTTGFGFHHALYQEALYDRLSVGQRTRFHQLIAARLEAAYRDCAAEVATELANHYQRANLKLEAIHYFQLAGQRAISRAAVNEARGHFAYAVKLLDELPEGIVRDRRELDLQLSITPALVAVIGGWHAAETERAWERAVDLCERLGDSAEFPALFGMYALCNVRGKINRSNPLAQQLVTRAERSGDFDQMLYAHIAMSVSSYFIGEFTSSAESAEICTSIYDFEHHRSLIHHYGLDAGVWGLCFAAAAYWQLGYPDKALDKSGEALALARKQSHPLSLAQAELWTGILRQMRGEPQFVEEISGRLRTLSNEHGLTDWLYWTDCLSGWAIAIQGHEEGIEKIRENQKALEARGLRVWRPYFHCVLADACLAANRLDDGMHALEDAITTADEGQERAHESQIYRLKGEILLRQSARDISQAQTCFERAIEIARAQSAKSFELQAATSYARLLFNEGKRKKASSSLEGVYRLFTEGFDTADLRNAKGLLDELGQ